jgi:hypothetical protein
MTLLAEFQEISLRPMEHRHSLLVDFRGLLGVEVVLGLLLSLLLALKILNPLFLLTGIQNHHLAGHHFLQDHD